MPVFEYRCGSCGKKHEVLHRSASDDTAVVCPDCSSHDNKRLFSTFSSAADGTYSFADGSSKQSAPKAAPSCACGSGGCGSQVN